MDRRKSDQIKDIAARILFLLVVGLVFLPLSYPWLSSHYAHSDLLIRLLYVLVIGAGWWGIGALMRRMSPPSNEDFARQLPPENAARITEENDRREDKVR